MGKILNYYHNVKSNQALQNNPNFTYTVLNYCDSRKKTLPVRDHSKRILRKTN